MPRKMKAFGTAAAYTVCGTILAGDFVREQLNKNIKGLQVDEDGLRPKPELEEMKKNDPAQFEIEKARLLPQEVAYIEKNWQKILSDAVENRPVVTTKPSTRNINNYLSQIIPGYKPLTRAEQKKREELSDTMRKKYTAFSTRLSMATQLVEANPPSLTRTQQTMLRPDLSEEGMRFNREVKEAMSGKDPQLIAKVIGQTMETLANIDFDHMDLTDDQYVVDHFEELEQVLSTGTEIQSLVETYQKYADVEDNELTREAFARLNAVQDIAAPLRMKVDAMCSPVYSQVRVEQIQTSYRPSINDYPDPLIALFGSDNTKANERYVESLENIGNSQVLSDQTPFMRRDLTPQQRLEEHRKNVNDPKLKGIYNVRIKSKTQPEKKAEAPEEMTEMRDTEQLEREAAQRREQIAKDRAAYEAIKSEREKNDIAREKENAREPQRIEPTGEPTVQLPDINEMRRRPAPEKITIEAKTEEQLMDEEYGGFENEETLQSVENAVDEKAAQQDVEQVREETAEFRRTQERLQEYEQKFRQNIQVIQKAIPGFKMTEQEIKEYVSPERLQFVDAVQEHNRKGKEAVQDYSDLPTSLNRCMFALMDQSGTPEAKQKNDKMVEMVKDDSLEGIAYRKELFANLANRMAKLDDTKLSPTVPTGEKLKYIQEHLNDISLGFDFQRANREREVSLGIKLGDADNAAMSELEARTVDLGGFGGAYTKLVNEDAFMTVPFEKFSKQQAEQVLQYAMDHKDEFPDPVGTINTMTSLYTFSDTVGKKLTTEKPAKEVFSAEDFTESAPSVEEMHKKFTEMHRELKDANSFFSRNSPEYEKLLSSLEKGISRLDKVEGEFAAYPKDLEKSINDVFNAAKEYSSHVGGKGKNANQERRVQCSRELERYLAPIHGNEKNFTVFVEKQNQKFAQKQSEDLQKEESVISAEEQRFNEVAKRTDRLRQDAEKLPEGALKKISLHQAESRDDLLNYVGRKDLDMNAVKPLVAKMIVGTRLKLLNSKPDKAMSADTAVEKYDKMAKSLQNSEPFNRAFSKMKPEDIMDFLEGPGEKAMTAEIDAGVKAEKQVAEAANQPKTEKVVQEASKQVEQSNASVGGLQ